MRTPVTELRITPKRLGQIEMERFCPRCYWYLLQQRFKPPFNHFGGAIFTNMEQAEMAVLGFLMQKSRRLPKEFAPLSNVVGRVEFKRHSSTFKHTLESGVILHGVPDDLLDLADGSIAVIDHKTAQPKGIEDPFMPCYEIQVIGYGFIAEFGLKLGEVSTGGLLYWGAEHGNVIADPESYYFDNKLWMPFAPKFYPIKMDYSRLDAPLDEAIRLWNEKTPPDGAEKCRDCKLLAALLELDSRVQGSLSDADNSVLSRYGSDRLVREHVRNRADARRSMRQSALTQLHDEAAGLSFAPDGMVANWELFADEGF